MPQTAPQTAVVLAMSADGKITDGQRSPARFGSGADQAHLEARVAWADAVVFGAGTLRAYGSTMSVRSPRLQRQRQAREQPPQPIQMVCSASGQLDPQTRFFRQPVPRWLLTTTEGARNWQTLEAGAHAAGSDNTEISLNQTAGPGQRFERIWIVPQDGQGSMDWRVIWRSLAQAGIQRVAVLGGGQLTAALFGAGLVQELWLTVCPLILGGSSAPTPVDGTGFGEAIAPRLRLQSLQQHQDEVFLHYRVTPHPESSPPAPPYAQNPELRLL